MSFTETSLPRSGENNRQAPSLYDYNLLVQKVNRLEAMLASNSTSSFNGYKAKLLDVCVDGTAGKMWFLVKDF